MRDKALKLLRQTHFLYTSEQPHKICVRLAEKKFLKSAGKGLAPDKIWIRISQAAIYT